MVIGPPLASCFLNICKKLPELPITLPNLTIPILVLGSILSGLATLVEASAITVLYAFVLEFFIRRNLRVRGDLNRVVGSAATLIGGVLLILGVALGLTNFFVIQEIPSQATVWVQSFVQSPLFFLLLLN